MKRIDDYINKIYKNFDLENEEIIIMKEETKNHLYDEVEDLKKQGLTEEQSIDRAMSNFGNEKSVKNELKSILKRQEKLIKLLIKFATFVFIVASIFKSAAVVNSFINRYDKSTSIYMIDSIERKIKNMISIDENTQNEITQLVDEFNKHNNNGLYYIQITKGLQGSYIHYKYNKPETENLLIRHYDGKNNWNFIYKISEAQAAYDYNKEKEASENMVNLIINKLGQSSNYLFAISTILLCVYFISKAYLKNTQY
ncbi:permease prefix domain 1-containing protein [Clostridium swellfunianum]|uniref:permease prefix domain 1-containing protein n=1 Tax=Clostridium swellfunianum TaxID=1367462 RepID=UPI00202FB7DE|nr:permease prefix domain 1-containing protein [Clostridium swellfunianum]MCM0651083.1 permease prefix domain 1-containing protein [Clostridium swellfunianum]